MNKLLKGGLAVLGLFAGVCLAAFAEPSAATSGAARDRAQVMNRIDGLLAASKTFYLATVDGDQPKLRPLGAHHVVDGKGRVERRPLGLRNAGSVAEQLPQLFRHVGRVG